MPALQIYDRRERALVSLADRALALVSGGMHLFSPRAQPRVPTRILLLRLERIGDLVMTLPAIRDVRALAPAATIDLIVGSWNARLAEAIPAVDSVETMDTSWLARDLAGPGPADLLRQARRWRRRRYDLAINFEPDVRSNLLLFASGAAWRAGWSSGGGGPLLDRALEDDPRSHTIDNARRLVSAVFGADAPVSRAPLLCIPDGVRQGVRAMFGAVASRPLVAVHASGGRAVKQWEPANFASVAQRLALDAGATIVLTGSAADRALSAPVAAVVPREQLVDITGETDLLRLAAVLERVDVLISGDTGPMHLASAVGTPVVAVFGPSDPRRYAPSGPADRVVRVDLPCSPCNRIRLPPARCLGHTPDCLAEIPAGIVLDAALSVLNQPSRRGQAGHATA